MGSDRSLWWLHAAGTTRTFLRYGGLPAADSRAPIADNHDRRRMSWHGFFVAAYRLLRVGDRPLRWVVLRYGFGNVVELTVAGRHSGEPRRVMLGLLRVGRAWYLGHPDRACAWTLNVDAAGEATIAAAWLPPTTVGFRRLPPGDERETVIRATFRQHPFPGGLIYWLARDHVRRVGVFYRLD